MALLTQRTSLRLKTILWLGACFPYLACPVHGSDWPQWRYDAGRGAATPDALPAELHLQWTRELAPPRPAWPDDQPSLRFDASYSPVAAAGRLFVPSMVDDSLAAYDLRTGEVCWKFFADGPVRLAPIASGGRVWFGSDDGFLYCLDAADGRLRWRVPGGPQERRVLGNDRLISSWPIRTGPVLLDGTIYFTAGIWPFMGIFVKAVDADSGQTRWIRGGESMVYTVQPHNSPAFASLVPRGHLAATSRGLIAPGGRTQPGVYDLRSGKLRSFRFGGKGGGTCDVSARANWFFAGGTMQSIDNGDALAKVHGHVHDDAALYDLVDDKLSAWGWPESLSGSAADNAGEQAAGSDRHAPRRLWTCSLDQRPGRLLLKAGPRFYAAKSGVICAIDVEPKHGTARVSWTADLAGDIWTMLAADQRLVVVTLDGRIACFGPQPTEPLRHARPTADESQDRGPPAPWAASMFQATGVTAGYCLVVGPQAAERAAELAGRPGWHVIAIDPDADAVDSLRRQVDEAGEGYGTRIVAHAGDAAAYRLPPYLANLLVVADDKLTAGESAVALARAAGHALRPYGGMAWWPVPAPTLQALVRDAGLDGVEVRPAGDQAAMLVRPGAPPGAADWTHQYADAANSVCSADRLVRAPLGLLWFGGPSNADVLPRHGHGPAPQVAGGRLVIEGPDMLRALDIYTGRLLWQVELPGLGRFYDNTSHQPGANEIGSNYVTLPDAVYVAHHDAILVLDAATGRPLRRLTLDGSPEAEPDLAARPEVPSRSSPRFGWLAVCGDVLVATTDALPRTLPGSFKDALRLQSVPAALAGYGSASRRLIAWDRHAGSLLWQRPAAYSFRHNGIALGAETVFCIDSLSAADQSRLDRRGQQTPQYAPRLWALDLRTGQHRWSVDENIFGTFLNYSAEHDVLLQAGSAARDRAADEAQSGMVAYRGRDGQVIWQDLTRRYNGPCMLRHDTIHTQGPAYSLLTGQPQQREHPLTGRHIPWSFTRNYGCNTAVASEHLLLFRSAAAGFCDLERDSGTANLGGFRSSCTSNMIAAGGVLTVPEYTRTCSCPYQNQTSLALVHDPGVETWSFDGLPWDGEPIQRVGINFGAPGNRRADHGTLWLDWPNHSGPSPDVPVSVEPAEAEYFCQHSALVRVPSATAGLAWVAASGVQGIRRAAVTLSKTPLEPPRSYTVRLHFAEPDRRAAGERVFAVRLQGQSVLSDFDVVRETGASHTSLVREFRGVQVRQTLELDLEPQAGTAAPPLVCGIELVADDE